MLYFPKVTKKDWSLSAAPNHANFANFANFQRSSAKQCEYFSTKFQCKNWPAILPLNNDIWNLALILMDWLWWLISQKWQKRNVFCQRRSNTPILPIFSGRVQKNVNIFHQNFNAKTDRLSFLFVMICETWHWYYRFGCEVLLPKSDKSQRRPHMLIGTYTKALVGWVKHHQKL